MNIKRSSKKMKEKSLMGFRGLSLITQSDIFTDTRDYTSIHKSQYDCNFDVRHYDQ